MSKPQSEEHYLASMVPPSVRATAGAAVGRRGFLKGAAGAGVALSLPALLAACGGSSDTSSSGSSGGSAPTGTVTVGSNASDDVPKKAYADVFAAFEAKSPKLKVKVNTVDHNTFQEQINNYLQGSPDDVFTWFAGYRMRFFAAQGLAGDISDVWDKVGANFSDSFKKASTGDDGKQYFVPIYNYPWVLMYRKSLFAERGYTAPTTMDDLTTLSATMKKDGLEPIAFADKDGWPAMGTFDILNMRTNGYDFHVSLMAGKESWEDPKVRQVFSTWADLLPYHQAGSLGRTWQEAAQSLVQKKTGMYLLGTFASQQFTGADLDDLDFFAFPEVVVRARHRLDRCPDRRSDDGVEAQERGRRQGAAGVHRLGRRREHLPQDRPGRRGCEQAGGPERLQRGAEEVGRDHRLDREHRPVPRP